jgi:hypothetical protein
MTMTLKLSLAAAAAALTLSGAAAAQDWTLVSVHDQQLTFADKEQVKRNAVAASLWALESYPELRHAANDWYPHRSRSVRYVFNCSEATYAIAEWIMYERALGHGRPVWADRADAPTFLHVQSSDPQAALMAAACGGTALALARSTPAN